MSGSQILSDQVLESILPLFREEMSQYTAHLDWHFRVNRREKDNARKAQSR